jgi:hypothetical protein
MIAEERPWSREVQQDMRPRLGSASAVLRSLGGLVYDAERFTDYIGGSPEEAMLVGAPDPGGVIRFDYRQGQKRLSPRQSSIMVTSK